MKRGPVNVYYNAGDGWAWAEGASNEVVWSNGDGGDPNTFFKDLEYSLVRRLYEDNDLPLV